MTNTNKLKGRLRENGMSQKDLANLMGLSVNTMNSKLNGKREFKVSEIDRICNILEIQDKELYFFMVG